MAETTYLEAIRQALFEEMGRDPAVVLLGEDVGRLRRGLPGFQRIAGAIRLGARDRHADQRIGHRGRCGGHGLRGLAARGGNAVHRLHRLLLQPGHQLRGEVALPVGRAGADRAARAVRRRRAWRPVPFGKSGDVFRAHAGPQGCLSGNRLRREGFAEIGDTRQ